MGLRWMMFVDGENFTIRGQKVVEAAGVELTQGRFHSRNTFLWAPVHSVKTYPEVFDQTPYVFEGTAQRTYYYTATQGDASEVKAVERSLHDLGFMPRV